MLYTLSGAPAEAFAKYPMPRKTAVFGPTFDGEGIVRSADITRDPRYGRNDPYNGMPADHLPVRSYLAVPVRLRSGEVLGGLFFGHAEPGIFSEQSERGLEGLAAEAAVAIDNVRLVRQLQSLNERLEEEVRAEVERRTTAEEALRQAQKMEAVGQLTGGIAHDFNNLLAGISGSLEVIERRISQGRTEGIARFLSGAQTSAQRAAALTQRLLAFSRRQTLDPKPTDANRLVLGMEDLIHRTVGPAIKVEVVGAAGLWATIVDQAQLESSLLNLAINARDAMPEGGRLIIETANKWLDERAALERDIPAGQYISICVTDTGTGIPKNIADLIFDPFFTTKPIGQGTGLGLSMIHGFVRQSGGQIRVYSEVGQGTTMCLYLPRYVGEPSDDEQRISADIPELGAGETVLVIDDEPTVRMLIVDVLEEAGYSALEAEDGPSGLKLMQAGTRVALLITDVGLPGGMNGRQVADAARELQPGLKVLFITGFAENAAISGRHLEPGMAVMTKPFVMAELANKITEMIEH
jgi:signal transduction histidine kinase